MTVDEIPFEHDCGGDLAEFDLPSGEWLRVRRDGGGFLVTRFAADKTLLTEATHLSAKALAALLA